MPDCYFCSGTKAITASDTTVLALGSSSTRRVAIYHIILGTVTPSDNSILWRGARFTTAGSGGSGVQGPNNLDSLGPTSGCTALSGPGTEPTYGGSPTYVLDIAGSVRNTLYWMSNNDDRDIKLPIGTANGVGVLTSHATVTPTCKATFYFRE